MSSTIPPRLLAANFAATILTSAFLLFQVQPIISRFILPWFGGSPAVWTTCMVFFQCVLFAGYAYAHLLGQIKNPKTQMAIHLCLLASALAMLPIAPDVSWKPTAEALPTWHILSLLAASVGLPYFVLSTTGPLVQMWFSRAFVGRSPYRLYSLSNVGSLAALLSYPFVVEPALDLHGQAGWWSIGFATFVLLCGIGGMATAIAFQVESICESAEAPVARPTLSTRLLWIGLPAFASMMLLATTNHVCQDVAVIPFLWVLPLSLYLLSFIICFDHERWYWRRTYAMAAVMLLCGVAAVDQLITTGLGFAFSFTQELSLYFVALFAICMVCHGELARLKPHPRYLTEFYLMISAGGALGGLFVSLAAPVLFNTFLEWRIGLLLGTLIAAIVALVATGSFNVAQRRRLGMLVPLLLLAFVGINCAPAWRRAEHKPLEVRTRSFYGTANVLERDAQDPEQHKFLMYSGRIVHGLQFSKPGKRSQPNAYYAPQSGIGRTFARLTRKPNARVGVIGLGSGTMAAYCQPRQYFRFYEINPEMQRLAETYFTYLKDCRGKQEVILGDGRLSLERESPQQFNLLVLDAFCGDAVPAHLLTREAMDIYLKHLKPDGELAFNISNRYLNLVPVVERLAEHGGFTAMHISSSGDPANGQFPAEWIILSRSAETIAALKPFADAAKPFDPQFALWTDHHSNLFEILK
jgi:hypothetical protein